MFTTLRTWAFSFQKIFGVNSWGAQQIDRCIEGLSSEIFQYHIDTENMSIEDVAEKIACT